MQLTALPYCVIGFSVIVSFLLGWSEISRSAGAVCTNLQAVAEGAQLEGSTFTVSHAGKNVGVTQDCDERLILASIPKLREEHIFNHFITDSSVRLTPHSTTMGLCAFYANMYIECLYNTSTTDALHFEATLSSPDDYGRATKHPLYSFSFNRPLFDKIYWPDFSQENLMKTAPRFRFSEWFLSQVKEEKLNVEDFAPLMRR